VTSKEAQDVVLNHACPGCGSKPGQPCRRRHFGRTYTTPCTVRTVIMDRTEGCVADQLGIGNDELVALLMAAQGRPALKKLYRRLV
jgi:hypothetical protein